MPNRHIAEHHARRWHMRNPNPPDLRVRPDAGWQIVVVGPAERSIAGEFSPDRLRSLVDATIAAGAYPSAAAVARAAQMDPQKLQRLLAGGVANPSIETVVCLVAALGCRFVDLLE